MSENRQLRDGRHLFSALRPLTSRTRRCASMKPHGHAIPLHGGVSRKGLNL